MPNWLRGISTWVQGHKAQAAGMAVCIAVMAWFMFVPGETPEVVEQREEEELFGAGALPGDATTSGALARMQASMDTLAFQLKRQQEAHSRLARDVEAQSRKQTPMIASLRTVMAVLQLR